MCLRYTWKWLLLMQILLAVLSHAGSSSVKRPAYYSDDVHQQGKLNRVKQAVQQQQQPQVYWATDLSSQQKPSSNSWSQIVGTNQLDRDDWNLPPPIPDIPTYIPLSTPAPPPPPPPSPAPYYAPAPTYTPPQPPPVYAAPSPPAPPSYAQQPSYSPSPAPTGYYYYYYPTKVQTAPTFKELLNHEKEYLSTLIPGGDKLMDSQKVWIAVLAPLIVVALVVPLAAIIFSGFTVTTTTGRKLKLNELNFGEIRNELDDLAGRVLQSEECVQRLICNLGSYAADVPYKSYIIPIVSSMAPDTMKENVEIFQQAASSKGSDSEIRASQCSKYKCSMWNF